MSAICVVQRFAEMSEEPVGDAAGSAGKFQQAGHALQVALFTPGEELGEAGGDLRRRGGCGGAAKTEAMTQPGRLLRNRVRFLQPRQCLDDALARFAELLRGCLEFEREILWPPFS